MGNSTISWTSRKESMMNQQWAITSVEPSGRPEESSIQISQMACEHLRGLSSIERCPGSEVQHPREQERMLVSASMSAFARRLRRQIS